MTKFHSDDYVHFLQHVTPDNKKRYGREERRYNMDEDCPVFYGLFKYCQMYTGGSIGGAVKLNQRTADIAINWAGGLHHAKRSEASGFCYINDIVLAILELLKVHARVLYIDIDIHHGDGVEEAFYDTPRVMTASFHKYGEYFPGTGGVKDIGVNAGSKYSINFPLMDGMDDESYQSVFQPIMKRIMETFQPGAVVLQCGADSLSGDRLGCFNLSLKGHAACVAYMKTFNVPLLVLGGGGYTIKNVSRCWANETGVLLDAKLSNKLPYNDYYGYYAPEYTLHITPTNMENQNSKKYLERTRNELFDCLGRLPKPTVEFKQMPGPSPLAKVHSEDYDAKRADQASPDVRVSQEQADKLKSDPREFYNGDRDQDGQGSAPMQMG